MFGVSKEESSTQRREGRNRRTMREDENEFLAPGLPPLFSSALVLLLLLALAAIPQFLSLSFSSRSFTPFHPNLVSLTFYSLRLLLLAPQKEHSTYSLARPSCLTILTPLSFCFVSHRQAEGGRERERERGKVPFN